MVSYKICLLVLLLVLLRVLILIVVEDGLVLTGLKTKVLNIHCLNPYCSGRWSRTLQQLLEEMKKIIVLILIVVEDGLVLDLIRLF